MTRNSQIETLKETLALQSLVNPSPCRSSMMHAVAARPRQLSAWHPTAQEGRDLWRDGSLPWGNSPLCVVAQVVLVHGAPDGEEVLGQTVQGEEDRDVEREQEEDAERRSYMSMAVTME